MTGPLRSAWDAPVASPPPPRRVWRDWALVGLLAPLTIIEAIVRPELHWGWLQAAITLALVVTLLWRRAHPLPMFAISVAASTVLTFLAGPDNQLYSGVFLIILGYAVFRWGSGRAAVGGVALMLCVFVVSTVVNGAEVGDVIGGFAVVLATLALALVFRVRASARAREVDQARALEREQFARDLHDTVAHHVSAIAIQAQAGLATVAANPEAASEALRVIEKEASRTLAEMRAMVRVLRRDDTVDLAPSHRIHDIESLASTNPGGPVVTVQVSGDVDSVSAAVGAAAYRIAQESVTNARRHARNATRINVIVEADETQVSLTVRDDGDDLGATTPGYGITGMTERTALLGGSFTAGRGPRGWVVTAVLPRTGWIS